MDQGVIAWLKRRVRQECGEEAVWKLCCEEGPFLIETSDAVRRCLYIKACWRHAGLYVDRSQISDIVNPSVTRNRVSNQLNLRRNFRLHFIINVCIDVPFPRQDALDSRYKLLLVFLGYVVRVTTLDPRHILANQHLRLTSRSLSISDVFLHINPASDPTKHEL